MTEANKAGCAELRVRLCCVQSVKEQKDERLRRPRNEHRVHVAELCRTRWVRLRQNRSLVWIAGLFFAFSLLSLLANQPELLRADIALTRFVQCGENPLLTSLAIGLTLLGSGGGLAICAAPTLLWLLITRRPVAAILTVAAISGHLLNLGIKALIHRPRPQANVVDVLLPAGGTSFPPGHVMTAVMFFGFLGILCYTSTQSRSLRRFRTGYARRYRRAYRLVTRLHRRALLLGCGRRVDGGDVLFVL